MGGINIHGWITKVFLLKQLLQLERDYMELKDIIADFDLLLTKIEGGLEEEVPTEEIANRGKAEVGFPIVIDKCICNC